MLTDAFVEAGAGHLVAAFNNYSNPIASTGRGTVRRTSEFGIEIDIPDSEAGRRVIAAHEDAGVIVRPFIAAGAESVIETRAVEGNVRVYEKAPELRALIVSATDRREGWPEPEIIPTPGAILEPRHSRRIRRWR